MENWYKAVLVGVLALATVVGILAGNQQSTSTAGAAVAPPVATVAPTPVAGAISITPGGFIPRMVTVHVGQQVTWVNQDTQAHGPVADNSSFVSSGLSQGQRYTWTPSRPGTYTYADFDNSSFTGTIVVKP